MRFMNDSGVEDSYSTAGDITAKSKIMATILDSLNDDAKNGRMNVLYPVMLSRGLALVTLGLELLYKATLNSYGEHLLGRSSGGGQIDALKPT